MTKATSIFIDILIVVGASLVAFVVEGIANTQGWVAVGEEARGASAVVFGALAAVGVVWVRGGSLADLGFRRPARWSVALAQALLILIVFAVAQSVLPLLASLLFTLPEPDWSRYASITGNLGAAIAMALILPLTASIPEEIIYRGFLIGRLSTLFGYTRRGDMLSVLVQAVLFAAVHYTWGIGGIVMALIMGLIWGTAYILCGRNLWVVILAHSGGHILFVVSLYLGLSGNA